MQQTWTVTQHSEPDRLVSRSNQASKVTRLGFPAEAFSHTEPAQYVFLVVPAISCFEKHPFTISSGARAYSCNPY